MAPWRLSRKNRLWQLSYHGTAELGNGWIDGTALCRDARPTERPSRLGTATPVCAPPVCPRPAHRGSNRGESHVASRAAGPPRRTLQPQLANVVRLSDNTSLGSARLVINREGTTLSESSPSDNGPTPARESRLPAAPPAPGAAPRAGIEQRLGPAPAVPGPATAGPRMPSPPTPLAAVSSPGVVPTGGCSAEQAMAPAPPARSNVTPRQLAAAPAVPMAGLNTAKPPLPASAPGLGVAPERPLGPGPGGIAAGGGTWSLGMRGELPVAAASGLSPFSASGNAAAAVAPGAPVNSASVAAVPHAVSGPMAPYHGPGAPTVAPNHAPWIQLPQQPGSSPAGQTFPPDGPQWLQPPTMPPPVPPPGAGVEPFMPPTSHADHWAQSARAAQSAPTVRPFTAVAVPTSQGPPPALTDRRSSNSLRREARARWAMFAAGSLMIAAALLIGMVTALLVVLAR